MSRQKVIFFVAIAVVALAVFVLAINTVPSGPTTRLGVIKLELNPEKAPKTVENFLQYVDEKHYDGTIFHRVMGDFMVQGGGFTRDLDEKGKSRPGIVNEARKSGLKNERGTIAMARTSAPDSATAQFFINVADNKFKLDPDFSDRHGYCVFGKVIEGMDIVDRIRTGDTMEKPPMFEALPVLDVIIKSARRDESQPEGSPPVVILEIEQATTKRP